MATDPAAAQRCTRRQQSRVIVTKDTSTIFAARVVKTNLLKPLNGI